MNLCACNVSFCPILPDLVPMHLMYVTEEEVRMHVVCTYTYTMYVFSIWFYVYECMCVYCVVRFAPYCLTWSLCSGRIGVTEEEVHMRVIYT